MRPSLVVAAPPSEAADWQGTARYRIVRRIGAGGMGVVYEAVDTHSGQHVALKTLLHFDPVALYRFKQEFRTLADVRHRNLVQLHELVVSDVDPVFFTMELVPGSDFLERVRGVPSGGRNATSTDGLSEPTNRPRGSGPSVAESMEVPVERALSRAADFDRLRPALRQLVEGLEALHAAGKLHRDIKPSNVLVTPDGRVVLLDFGVATDLRPDAGAENYEVVGTPRYMAPEQALGEMPTPAGDWYSVGVMLYEALVGRAPFEGSAMEILQLKTSAEALPPSARVEGVPPDLDKLCRDLLAIDPAERPSGREILRRLGAARSDRAAPAPVRDGHAPRDLIGREGQLRALRDAFETARNGQGLTVRVAGRAGMGKSSLVRTFVDELVASGGVQALLGRAYERESVPYKAVDGVIDALSHLLTHQEEDEGPLPLPKHAWALAHLFPVLRRVPSFGALPGRPIEDVQRVRRRAFRALRELLDSLARRRPLVVYLEDVQWGDTDSVGLLQELMRPPGAPPLLLLTTYREEDAATSPFLLEMNARWLEEAEPGEVRDITVGPLDERDAYRLALAHLGRSDDSAARAARAVARESGGCPLLVEELVRSEWAAEGATPAAVTLEQMVAGRLAALPEHVRRLAEVIAVAGRPMRAASLAEAAAMPGNVEQERILLETQRFARAGFRDGWEVLEPAHDRIRETIVAHLPPSSLREHHERLARVLEAMASVDLEGAAVHRLGAGDLLGAAAHAERAAEQAEAKLAFDHAARLLRLALDARTQLGASSAEVHRLRVCLAQALENAGRAADSGDMYLQAAESASGIDRIDLERAGATQLVVSGRVERGEVALRSVLAAMGMPAPRSMLGAIFWLLVYQLWLRITGLRFQEREPEQVSREDRIRIESLEAVSVALATVDLILGACISARFTILSLAVGDRDQVARALAVAEMHAVIRGRSQDDPRVRAARRARERVAPHPGPELESYLARMRGVALYTRGQYTEAVAELHAARANRVRPTLADGVSDVYLCLSLWQLGRFRELGRLARRLLRDAEDRGNLYTAVNLRSIAMVELSLIADDPEAARRHSRQASALWLQKNFYLQHWWMMIFEARTELYAGNPGVAWQRIERDLPTLDRSFLASFTPSGHANSAYWCGCCAVAAATFGAPDERHGALAGARRFVRELAKLRRLPQAVVFERLLRAALANAEGQRTQAVAALHEGLERAEANHMTFHAAAVRRTLGLLAGGDEGNALIAQADDAMCAEGARRPERFAAMFVPGRWTDQ